MRLELWQIACEHMGLEHELNIKEGELRNPETEL